MDVTAVPNIGTDLGDKIGVMAPQRRAKQNVEVGLAKSFDRVTQETGGFVKCFCSRRCGDLMVSSRECTVAHLFTTVARGSDYHSGEREIVDGVQQKAAKKLRDEAQLSKVAI